MPNSENNSPVPAFWGRLRSALESRRTRADYGDSSPRHRGIVIAVCLLMSSLLWFAFSMQETYTLVLDLPTTVVNLPTDEALVQLPPKNVRVQVRGEGIPLFQLYYNRPEVLIDASQPVVDLETFPPDLPKNVTLESVTPRTYAPRTEPRATRKVPVALRARIDTPGTHELLRPPSVAPDSIVISGAESIVNAITRWPTTVYQNNNLVDSIAVRLALVDSLSDLVVRDFGEVTLMAVAREFTGATREVEVVLEGAPSNEKLVTLEPSTIMVRYRVLLSQFKESMTAPDFFATVRYEDIRSDTTGRVTPTLHLPSNLAIRDVQRSPAFLRYYNYLVSE